MVSSCNVHVIGSRYMAFNGGFKPFPKAFIKYFNRRGFKTKRLFFLGNRLVDLSLADSLKRAFKCKIFKCLINRSGDSIAKSRADAVVKDLFSARELINKFRPDLVLSDFDNTLVFTGYERVEGVVERLRFWESHGSNSFLRFVYAIGSLFTNWFIKRVPYSGVRDDTVLFIKTLKYPLLIHSMCDEFFIRNLLKKVLACNL